MIIVTNLRVAIMFAVCIALTGCPQDIAPSNPAPLVWQASQFTGQADGCGNFFVYQFSPDGTMAITVRVDEDKVKITDQALTLDIASHRENLVVEAMRFAGEAGSYFCDDVAGDAEPVEKWLAVSGEVVVERHPGLQPQNVPVATHEVSVLLRNVRLKNAKSGEILEIEELKFSNVDVGWLPG